MKKCPKCNKNKELSEFSTRTQAGRPYLMSECRKCSAARVRARYRMILSSERLRERVLEVLGKKCGACGYSDIRALHVDHVNNNGYKERKKYGGQNMYRRILKLGGRGYQTLCANCNWLKRYEIILKERQQKEKV